MTLPVAQLSGFAVDIAIRHLRDSPVVRVLDAVDLVVRAGRVTALIGESGCGKSLVAAALCGLMPPGARMTGRITVDGDELCDADERRWRRLRGHHIGFVPQSAATSFTPVRTMGSQMAEVCRRLGADRSAAQLWEAVGLSSEVGRRYPHEVSGGMAQRAAIAAAIAGHPRLLIADEPTSALDPENAAMVWRLLANSAAAGAGVLVITHDLPSLICAGACDDVAVMRGGTVVEQASVDALAGSVDGYVRRFLPGAAP